MPPRTASRPSNAAGLIFAFCHIPKHSTFPCSLPMPWSSLIAIAVQRMWVTSTFSAPVLQRPAFSGRLRRLQLAPSQRLADIRAYPAEWIRSTFTCFKLFGAAFTGVVFQAMDFQYGFAFQTGSRKLLAQRQDPLPPTAPGPSVPCRDAKTGLVKTCDSSHALVAVLVGMSCMMFLVSVALFMLCWSVFKQRRRSREQAANPAAPTALAQTATAHSVPADSPEFDDAVFVQLPGDEKPQFFALPKPFLPDGEKDVVKSNAVDSAVNVKADVEKEAESEPPAAPPDDPSRG